jgi:hypothetical protein
MGLPQDLNDVTYVVDQHGAPDGTLQQLADWANKNDEGLPLTFVVGGGLISGLVQSIEKFYRESAADYRAGLEANIEDEDRRRVGNQLAENFLERMADLCEQNRVDRRAELIETGGLPVEERLGGLLLSRHIYLAHARYTAPGGPPIQLGHTCVQLSQIAAWKVGWV